MPQLRRPQTSTHFPPCPRVPSSEQVLQGKPLFPGRNVVHQLELITDLLGTPSPEIIAKVRASGARVCVWGGGD